MTFVAGEKLRASELNALLAQVEDAAFGLVGHNSRTSNSSNFTTIVRVLSTRAPVVAGRTYRVRCTGELFGNAGAIIAQMELRHTTDDTEPTTTSTVIGRSLVQNDNTGSIPESFEVSAQFEASSDGFLRVALCGTRVSGAVTVAVSAGATFPCTLTIEDVGDTIVASGTVY